MECASGQPPPGAPRINGSACFGVSRVAARKSLQLASAVWRPGPRLTSVLRHTRSEVRQQLAANPPVKNGTLLAADFKAGQLPRGSQGPQGPEGLQGVQGVPGQSVRAYAHVEDDGPALVAARTKNFTSVTHAGAANSGRYCLTPAAGIDPNTVPAVVSPDHSLSSGSDLASYVEQPSAFCAASQFEVLTQQAGVNSDEVAFTIIVP